MFDKLVESDLSGADLKPRRRIFIASFVFVGLLFATAVVAGIYAADYSLGTNNFDIAELLAPVAATQPEQERQVEPVRQQRSSQTSQNNTETIRRVIIAATDDPSRVPDKVSAEINPYRSVSVDRYKAVKVGNIDSDPYEGGGSERKGSPSGSPSGSRVDEVSDDVSVKAPPPPAPKAEKKTMIKTGGVVNGSAINLPKPAYSAAAQAIRAAGAVNVQVTIDENGKVISAKAVSGHIMLRQAAEDAAWRARFKPTTLSGVPVKVSGVIVYNFTR